MAALVDLYNLALARIGERSSIADPEERGEPARWCRIAYPTALRSMLEGFDWPFARRAAPGTPAPAEALAQSPFRYAFLLPAGCLSVRAVYPAGLTGGAFGVRGGFSGRGGLHWQGFGATTGDGVEAQYLATATSKCVIYYTRDMVDTGRFPPLFADALAWRLARDIAMSQGRSREIRSDCQQGYTAAIGEAEASAGRQQGRFRIEDGPLVTSRYDGYYGLDGTAFQDADGLLYPLEEATVFLPRPYGVA